MLPTAALRSQVLFPVKCNNVVVGTLGTVTKCAPTSVICCNWAVGAVALDVVTVVPAKMLNDCCELHSGKLLLSEAEQILV